MLFGFRLTLLRRRDGRLLFTVPLAYRLLLAAIGGFVSFALFATTPAEAVFTARNTVPLLFALLALLGAAYEEQWVFDRRRDLLLRRLGLWPLRWNRRLAISQLRQVGLEQFFRGRPHEMPPKERRRPLTVLVLVDQEDRVYRLEQFSASLHARAREQALAIASYCNIPFRDTAGSE
jgi:hypothetical protein